MGTIYNCCVSSVEKIAPGISYAKKSASIIEVTRKKVEPDAIVTTYASLTSDEWSRWGTDNKYPLDVLDKAKQDPVSMRALSFKSTAHYGSGLQLYKQVFENKKKIIEPVDIAEYPEIEDFFYENNIENFSQSIIQDFEWWNRYHVEYILNDYRNKIVRINSGIEEEGSANYLRTKDIRKAKRDKETGRMPGFFVSGDWSDYPPKKLFVPAFAKSDPFRHPKAMYEHKLVSISNDYYITPGWFSCLKWLEVTAKIPEWINSNIENSINIKYHIQIPEDYFEKLFPAHLYTDSEEKRYEDMEAAEKKLKEELDSYLAGEKNVHKAFYSKHGLDEMGKSTGWSIDPVPNDLKDEAWLKADQSASIRILTAHGVDPTLAGIVIGNTSGGSGSDLREKFNYHMQLNTVIPRQTTTEWFNDIVKRVNKYPKDIYLGYENIVLETLNANKSGYAQQFESTPTTENK